MTASLAGYRFYKRKKALVQSDSKTQEGMDKITADFEADQELLQYENERLREVIEAQLASIDCLAIRKKAKYILEKDVLIIQGFIQEGKLTYEELTLFIWIVC